MAVPFRRCGGLRSLRDKRALIDCRGLKLHLLGEGDLRLNLPPGSRTFPLELSEGGHLILPIGEFEALKKHRHTAGNKKMVTFVSYPEVREISSESSSSSFPIHMVEDRGTYDEGDESDQEWRRKHLGFRSPKSR